MGLEPDCPALIHLPCSNEASGQQGASSCAERYLSTIMIMVTLSPLFHKNGNYPGSDYAGRDKKNRWFLSVESWIYSSNTLNSVYNLWVRQFIPKAESEVMTETTANSEYPSKEMEIGQEPKDSSISDPENAGLKIRTR